MDSRQGDVDFRFAQVSAPQLELWLGLAWLGRQSDLQESALYSELSKDDATVNSATNVQQQLPPDLRTRREVVVDHRIIGPGDRTSELPTSTRAVQ